MARQMDGQEAAGGEGGEALGCGQRVALKGRREKTRERNIVKLAPPSSHTLRRCSFAFAVFTIRAEDKDSPFGRVDVDIFVSWEYDPE